MSDDPNDADGLEPGLTTELDLAEDVADTLERSSRTFSRTLVSGLRSAIVHGRSLDDILRRAAMSISASAFRTGLQPLTDLITGGANGLLSGLAGGVSGGGARKGLGGLLPFADGGVIGAPTAFPLPGGKTGLMGEAGREAVLPLSRGPDGRLGVAVEGQGSGAATPVVNVVINTPDQQSFSRSEAQVTAMLARAVARGTRGL